MPAKEEEEEEKTIEDYEKEIRVALKAGDKATALKDFIVLSGKQFDEKHDMTRALACVNKAVTLATELNDVKSLTEANMNGGIMCQKTGRVEQAIEYFEQELKYAHEAKEWKTEVRMCASLLLHCHVR
jgi:tetratricopeptide (TPR) repeat protein